ncbi:MAG: hypothetical protein LAN70_08095 [Acidobacteriia bacterium]|nr:hypothetical protein [Terriglobia bacterium]
MRKAHFGPLATMLSPLGLPVFVFLLLRSQLHTRWRKQVRWKDRTYRPATETPEMRQYKGEATAAERR